MDEIEKMQRLFRQRGMDQMLLKELPAVEFSHLCQSLDAQWLANETRLDIAQGKREDRRAKKKEQRERRTGQADTRPDKAERRRQDRRGARIL